MPQRVLFVCTDLEVGGTPHVVRDLATRLRGPDRVTAVACLAPWGPVAGEIESAGVRVRAIGARNSFYLPRAVYEIVRLGRSFDVVFSFLMHSNFVAAAAAPWMPGVRFIQSIQTSQPKPRWHWTLQGLISPAANAIVVPTLSVKNSGITRSHIPPGQIRVIPNAVDTEKFAGPRPPGGGMFRVGFLGRLDPIKRIDDLIRAVAMLPQAELHITGEGAQRAELECLIQRLDVGGRVFLHGTQPPPKAIATMDALVLPSDAEGFGLVLIEAMASGVPVIGTDVDGIRDVIDDERTGLLVPPRSPALIAASLQRLMDDAPLFVRLAAAARADVREKYGWPAVIAQYDALLNEKSAMN